MRDPAHWTPVCKTCYHSPVRPLWPEETWMGSLLRAPQMQKAQLAQKGLGFQTECRPGGPVLATLLAAPHPTWSAAEKDLTRSLPSGLQLGVQGLTQAAGTGAQGQPSSLRLEQSSDPGGLCRGARGQQTSSRLGSGRGHTEPRALGADEMRRQRLVSTVSGPRPARRLL